MFHSLVARSLPLVPKPIVRRVSQRYIAGETLQDAVTTVRVLNMEGLMATLDILGESVHERTLVEQALRDYVAALHAIRDHRLDSNVSIKPTNFGLKIDFDLCYEKVRALVLEARSLGNFVRIDMEDSSCTSATLDLYRRLRAEGLTNVGVVLQAYLRRTLSDAAALPEQANVRVCKGIYVEPADIAFKERTLINRNFRETVAALFDRGAYVGIATHDEEVVYEAQKLIRERSLQPPQYEFQMLLGVTESLRRVIRRDGHRLRVYVPYGPQWYAYSLRRLKENPQIAGYILAGMIPGRTS
ncbi:MAG TPA: proline dehydrogenase family protein [Candidatus Polarisedimenticolia bacterium]|nr:proline dehydrogenase family protein [Candidatus Polarisedimenticolia bacterium]